MVQKDVSGDDCFMLLRLMEDASEADVCVTQNIAKLSSQQQCSCKSRYRSAQTIGASTRNTSAQAEHSIKHTCMRTSGALDQTHMQARKQAHPSARPTCVFQIIDKRTEQKQNISQRQTPTYVFVTGATGKLCRTSQDTSSVKAQAAGKAAKSKPKTLS
jgi:hypothetical protein